MFILFNECSTLPTVIGECLHISSNLTYIWHQRYGHLHYKGLKTLQQRHMVRGSP